MLRGGTLQLPVGKATRAAVTAELVPGEAESSGSPILGMRPSQGVAARWATAVSREMVDGASRSADVVNHHLPGAPGSTKAPT